MTAGQRSALLWALVMLSMGGWLLHARIHPVAVHGAARPVFLIPLIAGSLDVVLVPLLFLSRRTCGAGYLLNGLFAIYGIVTMTHFAVAVHQPGAGVWGSVLNSTLADSAILFGDFMVSKALYDGYLGERAAKVPTWGYLAPGWWLAHFGGISVVYALGHLLWR